MGVKKKFDTFNILYYIMIGIMIIIGMPIWIIVRIWILIYDKVVKRIIH